EKDKRILIEVINNIYHAYASSEAFKDSELTSVTLPAGLVRLSADLVGESYRSEILTSLEKPAIELLVDSLFKSIDAMRASLRPVMMAVPHESSDWLRSQFEQQISSVAALNGGQQSPRTLIESQKELEPADLLRRHHELLEVAETLSQIDLKQLRDEVSQLES